MPPKAKALLPKINCIKFGEILIDENKKILLLCVNCFFDFNSVADFCKHLKDCESAKHVFQSSKNGAKLVCDSSGNLLTSVVQKWRELIVYDVKEKNICDIEAEILNPRWYKDTAPSSPVRPPNKNTKTYNNLIEEVTPFVQFKENLRSSTTKPISIPAAKKEPKILQSKVTINIPQNKQAVLAKPRATKIGNEPQIKKDQRQIPKGLTSAKACVNKVTYASVARPASPTLKRKFTTAHSNQASVAKNSQFAIQTAAKRVRLTDESQAKPPERKTVSKNCPNKSNIGVKTSPQAFQIKLQPAQDAHTIAKPQVHPSNVVLVQRPEKIPSSQVKNQAKPKPVNGAPAHQLAAPAATNNKSTADILNKLQTLGLKVKRTNPAPTTPAVSQEKNVALEIIKKLQSKGMKIERVPKISLTNQNEIKPNQTLLTTNPTRHPRGIATYV